MPKVLYIIGTLGVGGAETQLVTLINGLIHKGYQCELFTLESDGPLRVLLEPLNIVIHDGGYNSRSPKWKRLLQLLRAEFRLWRLARRTRPEILHAYLPLTNFMGAIAGWLAGIHTIITSRRALGTHQDRHILWKPFDRIANWFSDIIVVNSLAVRDDAIARDGADPGKLVHIPNGLDVAKYNVCTTRRWEIRQKIGLSKDETGLITVGNLIPYKGHADLLYAISKVVESYPNIRCYFAGEDRGIRKELEDLADNINISSNVVFLGQRNDIPELLIAMDVFILPSHEEGFSNALLEAMSSGLAIIATDVGGNREALDNGRLGLLVPAKCPDMLTKAIITTLSDREELQSCGQAGKSYVNSKFTANKMIEAHISLYTTKSKYAQL